MAADRAGADDEDGRPQQTRRRPWRQRALPGPGAWRKEADDRGDDRKVPIAFTNRGCHDGTRIAGGLADSWTLYLVLIHGDPLQ